MAKDPICGMTVEEATALHAERGGEIFYFCSDHCHCTFLAQSFPEPGEGDGCAGAKAETASAKHANPGRSCCGPAPAPPRPLAEHSCCRQKGGVFSAAHDIPTTTPPAAGAKYFCPMCPGVESEQPGDCPKCGMALERNPGWAGSSESKTVYACPMHPEIQQAQPGDCPKCGMALEPTTVSPGGEEEDNAEPARHDAAIVDRRDPDFPGVRPGDDAPVSVFGMADVGRQQYLPLAAVSAFRSRGRLGGLAIF